VIELTFENKGKLDDLGVEFDPNILKLGNNRFESGFWVSWFFKQKHSMTRSIISLAQVNKKMNQTRSKIL